MTLHATTQDAVFSFLADPATHDGHSVRRIDTHAASVFLAGERAYKVKRAVRFPFLDYSTLERRKTACEAEIEVNRPFAPELYHGVVPITREEDGSLAIGGHGTPAEWAVSMRRFDETQTLDQLADVGKIDSALAESLGRAVARAHAATPVADPQLWIDSLAGIIAQNDEAFRQNSALFPAGVVAALRRQSETVLGRIRPLLKRRGKAGMIRRCHGDLHLGNIVLIDGKPVLFDAIEFDPLIAAGDVLYDLAFLLMDLIERGLGGIANIVFNRYLRDTRHPLDFEGLAALPLFLSLRAAIRAKVVIARHGNAASSARAYFALAQHLLAPPPPQLVAIGGLSGTGKSVAAAGLAASVLPAPGAVVLRSDIERKAMLGVAEHERLPPSAYTAEMAERIYAGITDSAARVLAAGHSVIVDAVFAQPGERQRMAALAKSSGVLFHGLFLNADLATRLQRIGSRVMDASDADAAIARQQQDYDLGSLTWASIDASGTPEDTVRQARRILHLS